MLRGDDVYFQKSDYCLFFCHKHRIKDIYFIIFCPVALSSMLVMPFKKCIVLYTI